MKAPKRQVSLDWWSVILGAAAVLAVMAGLIGKVPW